MNYPGFVFFKCLASVIKSSESKKPSSQADLHEQKECKQLLPKQMSHKLSEL